MQSKLELDGHLHLMEAAHLMPKGLQEAILADMVPISWFVLMRERAGELRRGHLATEESDSSPGAIHWFEGMYVQGIHVTYLYNNTRVRTTTDDRVSRLVRDRQRVATGSSQQSTGSSQ